LAVMIGRKQIIMHDLLIVIFGMAISGFSYTLGRVMAQREHNKNEAKIKEIGDYVCGNCHIKPEI
jgi:hypothetical protein